MNTLTKCEIIEDFSRFCLDEKVYPEFISYNDLGIPLAISVVAEIADLKNHGKDIIDETYSLMCELLEVDPNKEYVEFQELLSDSNYDEGTE